MKTLDGRVVVVTGAGSGIGRGLAERLAERGAHLALADVNEAGLKETRERVAQLARGRRVSTHLVDVSNRARMEAFAVEVAADHGSVHVVINNAGVAIGATFAETSFQDFEWLFGINFWGVVNGCKFFLPYLQAVDEAHIVNISSLFGIIGVPMNSAYCASKFAVRGLTESLRAELAETHIGVTSVHPGGVATNIAASARYTAPNAAELRARATDFFRKTMPPSDAAERIVRGIERNSARVVITREAVVLDAVKRAAPSLTQRVIAKTWRKFS
jgi:NAD(P)-dependent dehydrogenase (short-subunit alcohol dehydrogenase family)